MVCVQRLWLPLLVSSLLVSAATASPIVSFKEIKKQQPAQSVRRQYQKGGPQQSQPQQSTDANGVKFIKQQPQTQQHRGSSSSDNRITTDSSSSSSPPRELIVGGTQAAINEFPWYVSATGSGYCGASLIAPTVLLTAAHCDTFFNPGKKVQVGAFQRGAFAVGNSLERTISRKVSHPQYNNVSYAFDIMLVQLSQAVTTIEPLAWNKEGAVPAGGEAVVTMGFGRTQFQTGDVSNTLLKVDLEIVSDSACLARYGRNNLEVDNMLCATRPTGDNEARSACQGDSGGPLVTTATDPTDGSTFPLQLGVVSWGVGCGAERYPGVYARPTGALDWMERIICEMTPGCTFTTPAPVAAPVATLAPVVTVYTLYLTFYYDDAPWETTWEFIQLHPDGTETLFYAGPQHTPGPDTGWVYTLSNFPTGQFRFVVHDNESNGLQSSDAPRFELELESTNDPNRVGLFSGPQNSFTDQYNQVFAVGENLWTGSPTRAPIDDSSTSTPAPTRAPTTPSPVAAGSTPTPTVATESPTFEFPCICLAGPLGCVERMCMGAPTKESCTELGCTWRTPGEDVEPPPNVEDPNNGDDDDDDDDNDGGGFFEVDKENASDLEKAGFAIMVGAIAAGVTLLVLGILFYCCCCRSKNGLDSSRRPSSTQPFYPDIKARGTDVTEDLYVFPSDENPDDAEIGFRNTYGRR